MVDSAEFPAMFGWLVRIVCRKDKRSGDACAFFMWKDENSEGIVTPAPMCVCHEPAVAKRVTKTGAIQGRSIWVCGHESGTSQNCSYFSWADIDSAPKCHCSFPAPVQTSTASW